MQGPCRWCGLIHGERCPSVKSIEFFPDGQVKKVEFLTPVDLSPATHEAGCAGGAFPMTCRYVDNRNRSWSGAGDNVAGGAGYDPREGGWYQ